MAWAAIADVDWPGPVDYIKRAHRYCGGVAQLVRALACHARGRRFESGHSRHFSEFSDHPCQLLSDFWLQFVPPFDLSGLRQLEGTGVIDIENLTAALD